ncbi:MAG: triphosphatase [Alphaproteobacteria bacterium]|jgi:inorganic triphosphatase YgiF|nr:triphosphatase [Alphaproteobacteria bacterium]
MSPPREIELKLEVDDHGLARLVRSGVLKAAGKRSARPATLVSVYFDTDKLTLRNQGVSLRVRRVGRRYVQTIKQDVGERAALFVRNEWERDIGGKVPDLDAARGTALEPLLSGKVRRELKPVFETRVRRTVYPVRSGNSKIELTVDKGKVEAGRQSSPLCEVELELKQGDSAELFKLARALAAEIPFQLAARSKAERGYALIAGEPLTAAKAAPVMIAPEANQQSAFQAVAGACLYHLVVNQSPMQSGDPEGLHQMRVALRRLRAAISLFSGMLADPQTLAMKAEFKWISGELGPARELDVFMKRVVKPVAAGKPNGPGVKVLTRELRQRRREAYVRANAAVASARFRCLILDTAAWIGDGEWIRSPGGFAPMLRDGPIAVAAADELHRRRKSILKRGRHLDALSAQRRHKLRIQAKKLRYAAEFFAGAFPGKKSARRRDKFVAGLEKLQDALGDLNDISVHEGLTERLVDGHDAGGRRHRGRARKAFAAGRLSGREEARIASVLKDAERAYGAFAKTKPFWP